MTPVPKIYGDSLSSTEKLDRIQRYLPRGITEKILSQREKIEGERRQVTIMFCDMTAYVPLAEKLGPEDTFSLMDQVYEILIHRVHEYEGIVNELRGDGILALFGAPIALEDAPQRALRSALAIQREMKKFNQKNKGDNLPPILLRIGINSGLVVVGAVGNNLRVQFTAVGDTINMAARMEGLADPGTTFLAAETFKLTKELFQFQALGKMKVKGKEKPVPVYKLISEKGDIFRPRLGSERMIYSEMVGRDSQIDRLELQVMKAINGEGSVVNIIGEAGIGKSRLMAELKQREAMKRVILLEGRAISIGRNLSFHPIIDLLKQWARIRHDDGETAAFNKLELAIRRLYPKGIKEILPFIATLMGMQLFGRYAKRVKGIEGEALEKLILKNVRELLIRATDFSPLVIIAEDLHWADTSSIELMESLFRLADTQRILFINVFRPGYTDTGDRLIKTLKERLQVYYVEIRLNSLDERKSVALINNMLSNAGLHHAVISQIVQRSGGNPYFIEEVVRSFIDEGVIVLKNGVFDITERINTIAIPYSINDVLMARIDRLEDKTRELVKIASVIGRNFFHRILSEVANAIENIDDRLSYLKGIELVQEQRRMGELEYLFKHALVQETAYESIMYRRRQELHLRVARSIEKIFARRLHEFYGMLAYHYSQAEDREKTEEFLIKAGEEAFRTAASDEALHYYEEALKLYMKKTGTNANSDKVAMLEKNIALALYNRGQHEEAVRHFDRALERYLGKLPQNTFSIILEFLSSFLHLLIALFISSWKFRRTPTTQDLQIFDLFYKKCKALAIINPKRFFIEFFFLHKKISYFDLKKLENGIGLFVSASPLFSFSGISFGLSKRLLAFTSQRICRDDVRTYSIYEICETMHNFLSGNWKEIRMYDDDLIKKSLDIGEIWEATHILYWHALPCIYMGSLEIVDSILRRLDDIFQVYQYNLAKTYVHELKSCMLMGCRRYNEALIEIKEGNDFEKKAGPGFWEIYVCEARIYISIGEIEKAGKCFEKVDSMRQKFRPVPFQMAGYYNAKLEYNIHRLKEILSNGNRTKQSEYRKKTARSVKLLLRNARKVARYRTESYKLTGEFYWLINRQKEALRWWRRAISEGERLGARLQIAGVFFELWKQLKESGSKHRSLCGVNAEDYLEMATSIAKEMKLDLYLDELSQFTKD